MVAACVWTLTRILAGDFCCSCVSFLPASWYTIGTGQVHWRHMEQERVWHLHPCIMFDAARALLSAGLGRTALGVLLSERKWQVGFDELGNKPGAHITEPTFFLLLFLVLAVSSVANVSSSDTLAHGVRCGACSARPVASKRRGRAQGFAQGRQRHRLGARIAQARLRLPAQRAVP